MPAESTVQGLQLWAVQYGATFPADADVGKLIERMRKFLGQASEADPAGTELQFAIGMEPVTSALRCGSLFLFECEAFG